MKDDTVKDEETAKEVASLIEAARGGESLEEEPEAAEEEEKVEGEEEEGKAEPVEEEEVEEEKEEGEEEEEEEEEVVAEVEKEEEKKPSKAEKKKETPKKEEREKETQAWKPRAVATSEIADTIAMGGEEGAKAINQLLNDVREDMAELVLRYIDSVVLKEHIEPIRRRYMLEELREHERRFFEKHPDLKDYLEAAQMAAEAVAADYKAGKLKLSSWDEAYDEIARRVRRLRDAFVKGSKTPPPPPSAPTAREKSSKKPPKDEDAELIEQIIRGG